MDADGFFHMFFHFDFVSKHFGTIVRMIWLWTLTTGYILEGNTEAVYICSARSVTLMRHCCAFQSPFASCYGYWQTSRRLRKTQRQVQERTDDAIEKALKSVVPLFPGIEGKKRPCLCLYFSISSVKKPVCQTVAGPTTYLSYFPVLFHTSVYIVRMVNFKSVSFKSANMDLFKTLPKDGIGHAVEARAAFQKTASDMEHERINLMSVITQVTPPVLWEHDTKSVLWLKRKPNDDPKVIEFSQNTFQTTWTFGVTSVKLNSGWVIFWCRWTRTSSICPVRWLNFQIM